MLVNRRLCVVALLMTAFAATGHAAPVPVERIKAEKDLAALKAKLSGTWVGEAPCQGRLTLCANGTYEWAGRGPGGDTDTGVWGLSGNAPLATLALKCQVSDDPDREGTTIETKLVQLTETALVFQQPEGETLRFSQAKKER